MAKAKVKTKKQTEKKSLTQNEILSNTLVPEDEQPYKLPNNWEWVRLEYLIEEIKNGTTIKQNKKKNAYPITRIETIQNNVISYSRLGYVEAIDKIKDSDWYKEGDISLSHINSAEHVGKTALIEKEHLPLLHGMNLLRIRFFSTLNPLLFQYYTRSFQYKAEILDRIKMAVNQVSINQKQIGSIPFPLPPFAEQQRMVKIIKKLFEKFDHAKELAKNALDSFETRKAAILHKAFSGELTAKWRKENGIKFESWEEKALGNILLPMNVRKPKGNNFRYIDIDSINNDIQEVKAPKELLTKNAPSRASREVQEGDTLFSMVRPYLKNIAYIDKTLSDCIASTGFYVCRPSSQINPKFLHRFLTNDEVIMKINSYMKGDNSPSVRAEDIENTEIILPSLSEQKEIVRILDCLFEKEKRARELCGVIGKIDLMKKAILAHAFRGELGTGEEGKR